MKNVIIIGGGFGGLTTGALLAHEGLHVTVIEKNHEIGGGLQSFTRHGIHFETGMHILGGLSEGGSVRRIFEYLGIMDKVCIKRCDLDCMDEVTYLRTGDHYQLPQGREAFTEALCRYFPAEREGIHRYLQACYDLTEEVDIFYLRPTTSVFSAHSERFMQPADEFIADFIEDPRLRDLLAYMNPMYGGVKGHTPAYIHALINVLYIGGQYHFIGRSQHLAELLADVIRKNGGEVITGKGVKSIHVEDKCVTDVETTDGTHFQGDYYISSIHVKTLLPLLTDGALPRGYVNRLTDAPVTYSAFILYLVFKPETFPYINHTGYIQDDYGQIWTHAQYDGTWPRGIMFLTPPSEHQGPWAKRMTLNCIMSWDEVKRWEHTHIGHRGRDYEAWKQEQAERIIAKLEQRFPQIRSCIDTYYTASPLTIRDYYASPEGSLYGYSKDGLDTARTLIAPVTRVRNLLLSGQCVNLHGICGVPLTAINTAECIFGFNNIVNKINETTLPHDEKK
ncbi:MAG: NAD(P)/FAD-dependent oxidoreductase [Bacteroidales bacterium]|nr:NAD(P)/FAD-dependent oxidoreductase [Bacteroidales bacterium]